MESTALPEEPLGVNKSTCSRIRVCFAVLRGTPLCRIRRDTKRNITILGVPQHTPPPKKNKETRNNKQRTYCSFKTEAAEVRLLGVGFSTWICQNQGAVFAFGGRWHGWLFQRRKQSSTSFGNPHLEEQPGHFLGNPPAKNVGRSFGSPLKPAKRGCPPKRNKYTHTHMTPMGFTTTRRRPFSGQCGGRRHDGQGTGGERSSRKGQNGKTSDASHEEGPMYFGTVLLVPRELLSRCPSQVPFLSPFLVGGFPY